MEQIAQDRSMSPEPNWRRSSFCASGECVEVAEQDGSILVRDSKNPGGQPQVYDRDEWKNFVRGVLDGQFDFADSAPDL